MLKRCQHGHKKKRITLSVADKLKMLDRIKAGEPRQKLVAEMGISMRTLERIVANEAEIRDTAATIPDKSRKRKRTGKNEELLPLTLTPDFTYMSGPLICRVKRLDKHPSYIRTPLYVGFRLYVG